MKSLFSNNLLAGQVEFDGLVMAFTERDLSVRKNPVSDDVSVENNCKNIIYKCSVP
jgi:hypothetical protein